MGPLAFTTTWPFSISSGSQLQKRMSQVAGSGQGYFLKSSGLDSLTCLTIMTIAQMIPTHTYRKTNPMKMKMQKSTMLYKMGLVLSVMSVMVVSSVRPKPNIRPKVSANLPNIRPSQKVWKIVQNLWVFLFSIWSLLLECKLLCYFIRICNQNCMRNVIKISPIIFALFLWKNFSQIGTIFGRIFGRKFRPMRPNIRFRPKLDFSVSVVHYKIGISSFHVRNLQHCLFQRPNNCSGSI